MLVFRLKWKLKLQLDRGWLVKITYSFDDGLYKVEKNIWRKTWIIIIQKTTFSSMAHLWLSWQKVEVFIFLLSLNLSSIIFSFLDSELNKEQIYMLWPLSKIGISQALKWSKNKSNIFIDHLKLCIPTESNSLLIFLKNWKISKLEKTKFGFWCYLEN